MFVIVAAAVVAEELAGFVAAFVVAVEVLSGMSTAQCLVADKVTPLVVPGSGWRHEAASVFPTLLYTEFVLAGVESVA